ncbi:MAG: acyl-CoA desaturase [Bdellovibrio sp.]
MNTSNWPKWNQVDWPTTLFLTLTPLVGLIGTGFAIWIEGFSWGMASFSLIFAALTNLSITAGYHRLYSHRSYVAHPIAQWILVFIGTSAWQSSVLKWCTDHRQHHSEVDTDADPYSINKGFWYAHLGWMFWKSPEDFKINCPDLEKSAFLRFQHNHYIKCAIAVGFLLPLAVGWAFGYPLTGLFMAGALRIGLTQQSTFFVNSLCHTMGKQTYSNQITARDSLFVAFLTHGEGYHNFHHKFQFDYRNGIRWWQWDPTKWTIETLKIVGLATRLRTVSQTEILKARLHMESAKLKSKGYSAEKLEALKSQVLLAQVRLKKLKEDYTRLKVEYRRLKAHSHESIEHMKTEMTLAKLEFQFALKQWKALLKSPVAVQLS